MVALVLAQRNSLSSPRHSGSGAPSVVQTPHPLEQSTSSYDTSCSPCAVSPKVSAATARSATSCPPSPPDTGSAFRREGGRAALSRRLAPQAHRAPSAVQPPAPTIPSADLVAKITVLYDANSFRNFYFRFFSLRLPRCRAHSQGAERRARCRGEGPLPPAPLGTSAGISTSTASAGARTGSGASRRGPWASAEVPRVVCSKNVLHFTSRAPTFVERQSPSRVCPRQQDDGGTRARGRDFIRNCKNDDVSRQGDVGAPRTPRDTRDLNHGHR